MGLLVNLHVLVLSFSFFPFPKVGSVCFCEYASFPLINLSYFICYNVHWLFCVYVYVLDQFMCVGKVFLSMCMG